MTAARLVVAICVAVSATVALPAQVSIQALRTTIDTKNIAEWLALISAHRPDSVDAAATAVSKWSLARLTALENDLEPLVHAFQQSHERGEKRFRFRRKDFTPESMQQLLQLTADETARADVSRIARRGLVLHTDIARHVRISGMSARTNTLLLDDGRHSGDEVTSPHWFVARMLLTLVSAPADDDTVRLWYQAMTADGIRTRHWNLVYSFLEQGLRQVPDDARVLLHAGVLHETFGGENLQNAVELIKAKGDTDIAVRSRQEELMMAERFLRRATIADPNMAEASLRRGHVLAQLANRDDAIEALRRAASGTTDSTLTYYAMLLIGREEAAAGRSAAARAAFDRAAALFPLAQSPLLADSQLARRDNDPARVSAALRTLEALSARSDRRDPWWDYDTYAGRDADALIARFYESYRRGDPR